jgi:hypothetical protein
MPRLHSFVALIALMTVANADGSRADEPTVTAVPAPGQLGIRVGGEPFAVFNFGPGLAKPYVFPLRAPGGHVVNTVAPFDHKHHKGVWVGVEHVNGVNFWGGKYQQQDAVETTPAAERIANKSIGADPNPNGSLTVKIVNDWQGEAGKLVLVESTDVTIFPNRLMVYDIRLTAADEPVTFQDTKEGFLAIRVAPTMNGKTGGVIVNATGEMGEENCWGKTSPWVDYSGPVDGKTVGVALFDSPQNVRPSRYHVRAYGLFAISPFCDKVYSKGQAPEVPLTLKPGESFRVKYGLFPHTGDAQSGKVAEAYNKFVEWTK